MNVFLVSAEHVTHFMILVMNVRQMIWRLSSNSPQKEQVTAINPCIFNSAVMHFESRPLIYPYLCKVSIAQFSWDLWAPVSPQWVQGRALVGFRGKAPGSSEDTVIVKNDFILQMTPENKRKTFHN